MVAAAVAGVAAGFVPVAAAAAAADVVGDAANVESAAIVATEDGRQWFELEAGSKTAMRR